MEYAPTNNENSLSGNLTDHSLKLINKASYSDSIAVIEFCKVCFEHLRHNTRNSGKCSGKQHNSLNIALAVLHMMQSQGTNEYELEYNNVVIEYCMEVKIGTGKETFNIICTVNKVGIYNHKEHK